MPIIKIEMLKGRTIEQKRELVKRMTEVMNEVAKASFADTFVVIDEVERENWAIGGTLFSDKGV